MVVSGLLNKQVGGELGISEITVKAHRGRVMRKMQADSLPALVKMAAGSTFRGPADGARLSGLPPGGELRERPLHRYALIIFDAGRSQDEHADT